MAPSIGRRHKSGKHYNTKAEIEALDAVTEDDDDSTVLDDDAPAPAPGTVDGNDAAYLALLDSALEEVYFKCSLSANKLVQRRHAIAYLFIEIFKCPPKSEWKGPHGVIAKIQQLLSIPKTTLLEPIFEPKVFSSYTGQMRPSSAYKPVALDVKSFEAQIVADCLEVGDSIQHAFIS